MFREVHRIAPWREFAVDLLTKAFIRRRIAQHVIPVIAQSRRGRVGASNDSCRTLNSTLSSAALS